MATPVYPVYPSDLTDAEWSVFAPLLPAAKPGGRPRSVNLRRVVNGLFYRVRAGCAWVPGRYLPRDYGPWSTVHGLPLFSALARQRRLGTGPWSVAGTSA
jgi:transposase